MCMITTSLETREPYYPKPPFHIAKHLLKNRQSIVAIAKRNENASHCQKYGILFSFILLICTRHVDAFPSARLKIKTRAIVVNNMADYPSFTTIGVPTSTDGIIKDTDKSSFEVSSTYIDPLLINALQTQSSLPSLGAGPYLSLASSGIRTWRTCLCKGRFPIETDFENHCIWPEEPFFSKISDAMITLQLPRFVLRHPEIVSTVLLTLLRLTFKFMHDAQSEQEEKEGNLDNEHFDDDSEMYSVDKFSIDEGESEVSLDERNALSATVIDTIAAEIADSLIQEWNDVVSGVNMLDQLFGYDHNLLEMNIQEDENDEAMAGFGLEDGIWKHTGWNKIPDLQNHINSMQELKDLMKALGRRPTAENSDEMNKFAPRKLEKDGADGAQFDPLMRESVSGITLSGSLTEMLPSEAVLLRGSSGALRRLFMAKKAESKLLSYEMSGWTDVPSVPITRPLYMKRMPSAPGGPIIICLDTSWSMSGMREQLSKAVVLACVTMAHKQKRDCQVVAFSTERGVIEAGIITPDAKGINRLLDFLSHSFGGGTDVTGALKYAMEALDSNVMLAADILMISDGEIPDPPVSSKIMEALDYLKLRKGVEVHGLLVGKRESKPLSRLCTDIHNFLVDYDTQVVFGNGRLMTSSTLHAGRSQTSYHQHTRSIFGFSRGSTNRRGQAALRAKYSDYVEDVESRGRKRKKKGKSRNNDDDHDYDYVSRNNGNAQEDYDEVEDEFNNDVNKLVEIIKPAATESLAAEAWTPEILLAERKAEGSCWKYIRKLESAVEKVSEGLIEREEEARLVVLAMLSMEHILLLGVPGTGKSILGRRLSKLCNVSANSCSKPRSFFQRLLTKFTTPEELFGPLSLKSLENDEYRRCTEGFLPTASIAFLDEIFKANSAILNTLLTILNERKFDNAGGQEDCPIRCVVGASNELPESDELIALFDRFLIRKEVFPVSDEGVINLLSMSNPGCNIETDESCDIVFTDDLNDIIADLSIAANSVEMGINICELMRDLRTFMREECNIEISDRRLVKTSRLLKISAASQGRAKVDLLDCLLLQHCMWHVPEQKALVRDWIWDNITPGRQIKQFRLLLDTLRNEVSSIIRKTAGDVTGEFGGRQSDLDVIESLRNEANRITLILQKHQSDLARHIELLRNAENFLWLDPDEVKSLQQLLFPRAEKALMEVEEALIDCRSLELCLGTSHHAPSNELRLSVIESLWEEGHIPEATFTDDEMNMGMKEAKSKYDLETFRKWKRAKKRAEK